MGAAGDRLHGAGRHQGRHLDRRAADARSSSSGWSLSLVTVILLLPADVSLRRRRVPGGRGRAAQRRGPRTSICNDRYNLWSGLIGGMFLFLSYFGSDQIQVQRYLTGQLHRAEPAEPAVQRHGQDPDAVLHPVHRRHGVRVLPVRAAAAAVPARRELERIQAPIARRTRPSRRATTAAFERRRAGGARAGGRRGAPATTLRREAARGATTAPRRRSSTRRAARARDLVEHGRRRAAASATPTTSSSPSSRATCRPASWGW